MSLINGRKSADPTWRRSDLTLNDFRSRDQWWDYARSALAFFRDHDIPFWRMHNDNDVSSAADDYGFVETGEVYVVYLKNGGRRVDVVDLNNVRNHFGATGPDDGSLAGDAFPFDGVVDVADLNAVRNAFGAGEPSAVVVAPASSVEDVRAALFPARPRRAFHVPADREKVVNRTSRQPAESRVVDVKPQSARRDAPDGRLRRSSRGQRAMHDRALVWDESLLSLVSEFRASQREI